MHPRYRDINSADIPEIILENGTKIKIICGEVNGIKGPVHDIVIDPEHPDITVPPETTSLHPTKTGHTVLAYVIDGGGYFCSEKKPLSFATEGANYFDMQPQAMADNTTLVLFGCEVPQFGR